MTHVRTARALAPYLLRRPVVVGTALISIVAIGWLAWFGPAAEMPVRVRVAGVGLAMALAWVVEDAAGLTVAASPTPLGVRRLLRALPPVGIAATGWVGACAVARHRNPDVPLVATTIEIVALACLAVAVAARQDRAAPQERSGHVGALVPFVVIFATPYLPDTLSLAPDGSPTMFDPEHRRWLLLLLLGVLTLGLASRDPLSLVRGRDFRPEPADKSHR